MIGKLVIQRWAVLGAVVAPDQALSPCRLTPESIQTVSCCGFKKPFPEFWNPLRPAGTAFPQSTLPHVVSPDREIVVESSG